ncbi:hypothetical protein BDY17DRAFT_295469 [Neohortaea acidophila]|uniref:Uncharacterized protein n=1 Tax=Neohortaea acidophila TaxID=245834 RepID=A0A6A6PX87_9PEZI|nr:uncharacterized protein BDY17DRAFT_295469 [Neohortaea acidophila]KAF2484344.1 hypothetical protein BDY17DRAFT_295469 [Neohortaea acidophila]
MGVNETRKRLLRQLNTRYIWGKYPLLHAIIFAVELTMITVLVRKFNAYYLNRPVLTTMITNAVLGGIADTVAQTLTALRQRQRQIALNSETDDRDDYSVEIEIDDFDPKKVPWPENNFMLPPSKRGPPPFDFERLIRFMGYGFLWTPAQHRWYGFLDHTFSGRGGSATASTLKRVALDQFLFAPVGLAAFFSFITIAEGGGKRALAQKFQEVYIPALKANYIVWPAVQLFNFGVVPIQLQIPFVSTIGIAWTAYLSLSNSADEPLATPSHSPIEPMTP